MSLTVSVNHPHLAEGEVVSVGGLLAIENGGSVEVGPETEQAFIDQNESSISHYLRNSEVVSVSGTPEVNWEPPPEPEQDEEAVSGYMMGPENDAVAKALEGGEQ